MVIWIIGMSASGKTTLAKEIHSLMQEDQPNTVLVDGDLVRAISGNDLGHTIEDRWQNAQRTSRLCQELDRQGLNVVCAILSIFHESQRWNRENFSDYQEIYLKVSMDTLRRRDFKGLYERAFNKEENDVVGVDIDFLPPYAPDLVINNDQDRTDIGAMAMTALTDLGIRIDTGYSYAQRDLLAMPEKYEYSKYHGAKFLKDYRNSRSLSIDELEARMKRIRSAYADTASKHPWTGYFLQNKWAGGFLTSELPPSGANVESNNQFVTNAFLRRSIDAAISGEQVSQDSLFQKLLQRFEVSKKIYSRYELPDLRPGKGSSQDLISYGLFGTLLGLTVENSSPEKRLISTNALLKVNDILESQLRSLCTPSEHFLALTSMKQELEIVQCIPAQT